MKLFLFPVFAAPLFFAPIAVHAGDMDHMEGMNHDRAVKDVYAPAMENMHKDMMGVKPTGDADIDFMQEMIPHHQGAIDMAKIALKDAKDPEVKKLAQDILAAQEKEIAFMKDWLDKHPRPKK